MESLFHRIEPFTIIRSSIPTLESSAEVPEVSAAMPNPPAGVVESDPLATTISTLVALEEVEHGDDDEIN